MKRHRKIKWARVLFAVFLIMLIVGGIIMCYQNGILKNKKQGDSIELSSEVEKEESTSKETNPTNASLESAPSNYQDYSMLSDGEYITKNGYTLVIKDGLATIDGQLIVNKTYSVPESYKPENPYSKVESDRCIDCLEKEVMDSFQEMQSDASSIGLNIYIASGYRSYNYQNTLYNNYSAVSGIEGADTYSARPGHSEHQTGLCFDLNSVEISFANTDEGKWIQNNAYLYGFVIRYPKGKEEITGYQYEPWHLRYVGEVLAKELYHDGDWITMEEYYGISSSY